MYKARFEVSKENILQVEQKVYVPILICYVVHSVILSVNGETMEENSHFKCDAPHVI
jgi:hypothetical protein